MTGDIYVYVVDLPHGIHEMVTPCNDGYTVYLNARDTKERQEEAYIHVLCHISRDDFLRLDVDEIESNAHSA